MKTLIELFDETPIENVLAADVFRPETVIYLCPPEIAQDRTKHRKLREYFAAHGLSAERGSTEADRRAQPGLERGH